LTSGAFKSAAPSFKPEGGGVVDDGDPVIL